MIGQCSKMCVQMMALASIADGTMDDATHSETYPFRGSNQVISDRYMRENVCMYHLDVSTRSLTISSIASMR